MGTQIKSTPLRVLTAVGTMGASEAGGLLPLASAGLTAITPKLPTMPDVGKAPEAGDKAVQQAVSEARQRRARGRGFRSTILSQDFLAPGSPALKSTLGS